LEIPLFELNLQADLDNDRPETMGAVCAVVYLLTIIVFIPWAFYTELVAATPGSSAYDALTEVPRVDGGRIIQRFPHNKLASYLSAILSLQSVAILGISDDLFDIRWRHKVLIPAFAAIPMLIVYYVDFGVTHIMIPVPFRPYFGELVDLGFFYYLYMAVFAIFTPNSINILAGINGIEVSQSIVIAVLVMINDVLYLSPFTKSPHPAQESHLFSLYLLVPFVGVSLALWWHNWYPSKVFVGDTYCYFAGMVFVVIGILSHFSKTLILLLLPQFFNFAYSCPQIFGVVPCPRHRLPKFNARTGLLEPSKAKFEQPLAKPIQEVMKLLHKMKLLGITIDEKGQVTESTNFTIINLWLVWWGPMREDRLAASLLAFQAACGIIGLIVRHNLAPLLYTVDNLFAA